MNPIPSDEEIRGFGQHMSKWTEEQKARMVLWYIAQPLATLRQRQDFNTQYVESIYAEHNRFPSLNKTPARPIEGRLALALDDILVDEDLLIEAIWRQNFGDESWQEWVTRDT